MANKTGKSKETSKKLIKKKSVTMKKQSPSKRGTSKTELKNDEHFFIKTSQNLDIKDLSSAYNSPSIPSSILLNKEKRDDVSSKGFSKKEKQNQGERINLTDNKKPFDKKLFRLKKYSKKYKLQQWEEKRKKSLLREYQRSVKNTNEPKLDVAKIYEDHDRAESKTKLDGDNESDVNAEYKKLEKVKNKKPFLKPHERYQQIKEEKQKKLEEITRKKIEREEARKRAQKERMERNKKLNQKTKKGQPIMKYRIEMLLEKIEKSLKE